MNRQTASAARWVGFRGLLTVALVAATFSRGWADPTAPNASDRQITFSVASLLKQHLSRHPLDKEISERCLKNFLKALDPAKVYFYQSDIDEFMKHEDELSDAARRGDVTFAYTVFRTFLQRVDERVKMVDELLAAKHDFSADEQMSVDRDAAQYPRDRAEAFDRWRKRIKYDLLVLKVNNKEEAAKDKDKDKDAPNSSTKNGQTAKPKTEQELFQEAREKLARRYHSFAKRMHQIDNEELLEMYLNALTTSFDPHTDYMSSDTQKNFNIAMSLELEGIGASLMSEDGYTVVKKIIPGGAAAKDGRLKVEDKIIGVGQGDNGEMVDVVDMKLSDVVKLIRGKRNTIVRLEAIPAGGAGRKIYKITREKIELKDSEAKGEIFDAGRKPDGTPYRIGVIDLPSFYRDMSGDRLGMSNFKSTTHDVRVILDDFNRKHVDAVILDLRRNGGGALNEAISLTGLFIGEGPVVQVKDAEGRVQHLDDTDTGVAWSGPLVVLISKFSASASEILAGAIQDYGRGLIVGDHSTHGKGTVQSLLDLGQKLVFLPGSMGALKITMQQFYRPNGDSTQKRGVLSDVELPSLTTHLDVGEADLDYPLEFDKVEPLTYRHFDYVNPAILSQLQQLSQQRVQASDKFQKVVRNIARYKDQKAKKWVTLNEEKFLKERAELNADKEEEKAIETHSELNNGKIERDFYLDEAIAILLDFVRLQDAAKAQGNVAGAVQ
ncbi:MAG: carboxy terminal-processing peptidase [Thermoguttaceae bacterium]